MRTPCTAWRFPLALLATAGAFLAGPPVPRALAQPAPAEKRDRFGDPLPAGAVARLGTLRFRQKGPTHALAVSPDGRLLAAGGEGELRVWEADSGKQVWCCPGLDQGVKALAFLAGGRTLASVGHDGFLRQWEARMGRPLENFDIECGGRRACAFSPDGATLAAGTRTLGGVGVWRTATGECLRPLRGANPDWEQLFFLPPAGRVAGVGDARLVVWDAGTGERRLVVGGPRDPVRAAAASPDGKTLATGHGQGPVRLWDAATGKPLRALGGGGGGASALAFSPDGRRLAVLWEGCRLRLWDLDSGREEEPLLWHGLQASCLVFTPDGKTVFLGSAADALHRCDLARRRETTPGPGHQGAVAGLAFSPDGKAVAAAAQGTSLWDTSGRFLRYPSVGGGSPLFDHAGRLLSVCGHPLDEFADVVRIDPGTGKPVGEPGGTMAGAHLTLSPDGTEVFAAEDWRTCINVLDSATLRSKRRFHAPNGQDKPPCHFYSLAPDGRYAVLCRGQDEVEYLLWDLPAGKEVRRLAGDGVFSPDGATLVGLVPSRSAITPSPGSLLVVDLASGRELRRFPEAARGLVLALLLSGDGQTLVTGGEDQVVRLWEVATGQERLRLSGHQGSIRSLAFSPDGRLLASGSDDATALLWDLTGLGGQAPAEPTNAQLEGWWDDLRGEGAARAYRAVWRLALCSARAERLLAGRLRPVTAPEPARLARLLEGLGDREYAVRQRAQAALAELGDGAEAALREAAGRTATRRCGGASRCCWGGPRARWAPARRCGRCGRRRCWGASAARGPAACWRNSPAGTRWRGRRRRRGGPWPGSPGGAFPEARPRVASGPGVVGQAPGPPRRFGGSGSGRQYPSGKGGNGQSTSTTANDTPFGGTGGAPSGRARGFRGESTGRAVALDLHAEAFEVHVLALVGLAGAAALQADAQEGPQADRLAGVVVAVGVGAALQAPAPRAPLAPGVGVLLPAPEHAGQGLQGRAAGLGAVHVQTQFVGPLLDGGPRQAAATIFREGSAGPQAWAEARDTELWERQVGQPWRRCLPRRRGCASVSPRPPRIRSPARRSPDRRHACNSRRSSRSGWRCRTRGTCRPRSAGAGSPPAPRPARRRARPLRGLSW
jgi:WD40 repeat protein